MRWRPLFVFICLLICCPKGPAYAAAVDAGSLPVQTGEFRRLMEEAAMQPILPGNQIEELINGVEYFPAMLEAIRSAKETITFENFIWRSGEVSDQFIEALSERARAGVRVLSIVDGFGSFSLKRRDIRKMREAGVNFQIYNRVRFWNWLRWNDRTHRKLLIVDGKVGFIGGICIADDWAGDADRKEVWRDTEFRIHGPVVAQLQEAFSVNWRELTGETLAGPDFYPPLTNSGPSEAHCFISGRRGENRRSAREVHVAGINAARKSIKISHSYFVPDNKLMSALIDAARRGVRVQVITSGDKLNMVRRASRSTWEELMVAGIEFYEFIPTKYHCKVMIVDDTWITTGSTNFDDRSFNINDEANINVWNGDFAARQLKIFEEDLAQSNLIDAVEFQNRPLPIKAWEAFCGWFRPLL